MMALRAATIVMDRPYTPRDSLLDERPEHLALRVQLGERELDRLVARERFAERRPGLGVLHRTVDAELRGAEAGSGLADAVLVEEVLHDLESAALAAEDGAVGDPHAVERDMRVVGGHVEGPQVLLDLEAGTAHRDQEGRDAGAAARCPAGPGEDEVVRGGVDAGVPGLFAIQDP